MAEFPGFTDRRIAKTGEPALHQPALLNALDECAAGRSDQAVVELNLCDPMFGRLLVPDQHVFTKQPFGIIAHGLKPGQAECGNSPTTTADVIELADVPIAAPPGAVGPFPSAMCPDDQIVLQAGDLSAFLQRLGGWAGAQQAPATRL